MRPAAGITAMTVIKTLPSFCRKSKLKFRRGFCDGFPPGFPAAFSAVFGAVSSPSAAFSAAFAAVFSLSTAFSVLSAAVFALSGTSISTVSPAFTGPSVLFNCCPLKPPHTRTGVMGLIPRSFKYARSTSARRSPAFTWSPGFTKT